MMTISTRGFLGPAGTWPQVRIELHDIQGLFGGTRLFINGSGQVFAQIVQANKQESCFGHTVSSETVHDLLQQCVEVDLLAVKPLMRPGVADEARPVIALVNSANQTQRVWKWANDEVPAFDAIYDRLLVLANEAKAGQMVYTGPFRPDFTA